MRGKKRGLLDNIFLFLSGTLIIYGFLFSSGWHVAVSEPPKLNIPVPIYCNNIIAQLRQGFNDHQESPVNIVPQVRVVPGGQSIGVLLRSQGVIVVGHSIIQDQSGNKVNPAGDAGISIGDVILKINGEDVKSEGQVRDLAARAGASGQALDLEVKRGGDIFYTKINPVYCTETSRYRIGLLIKDSAAGLGTLTFYEPESRIYGALGHVITDVGSTEPFDLSEGKIIGASVQAIHPGKRGLPGEKIGIFQDDKQINGTISRNTKLGIFGNLQKPLDNNGNNMLMTVAPASQIHEGTAEILTVLKDEQVEKFSVEIMKINLKAVQDGKGIIIKITDPRLLEQTGGIIQGMSGSPIIQDGSLVGAVTHVFVNDPTRGYGVPVEWMLREAEIFPMEKNIKMAS
ncbi:MAG: SpoIVB peptidase precursor [Pelotomaculum sp. PtaB.Bin013]|nr:MAG: SpoIVB peptidase precursor [Pelotomaculum sp. PtaB.Bin013]